MPNPVQPVKRAKRVIPLGDPLPWDGYEIARRSETTDEDKMSAVAWWQANTFERWKELLQAKPLRRRRAG